MSEQEEEDIFELDAVTARSPKRIIEGHAALEQEIADLRRQLEEHQRTFDLRWNASMRAVKRWQEAHPGKGLTWPDHADLCMWLMDQLEAEREANRVLNAGVTTAAEHWEILNAQMQDTRSQLEEATKPTKETGSYMLAVFPSSEERHLLSDLGRDRILLTKTMREIYEEAAKKCPHAADAIMCLIWQEIITANRAVNFVGEADRQRERADRAEAALAPFAAWINGLDEEFADQEDDIIVAGRANSPVTFGDLRRACAAIKTKEPA